MSPIYKNKIYIYILFFLLTITTHLSFTEVVWSQGSTGSNMGQFQGFTQPGGLYTIPDTGKPDLGNLSKLNPLPDFGNMLKELFFGFVQLIANLIALAVGLIDWSLKPTFMDLIRNNPGVYMGWKTVRDFLNMFFIFFLLYSAFCTVFQISRYHIRNTWVMIVVMALLVNFSWPIARVLIDVSNVTMMWIMDAGGVGGGDIRSGSALMSTIGSGTGFANILVGKDINSAGAPDSWTNIFMGIIIGLLFLIVVMAVALLLVIRVVALALLLVFASAGFTMAAFPMTSSYANKWWNQFIKYLSTGPILLFVLVLSVSILQGMGDGYFKGASEAANKNGIVPNVLTYVVSLIILWTGIMTVGAMGDGASSAVLGMATKARGRLQGFGKSAALGMSKGAASVTRIDRPIAAATGIVSGVGQRFKNAEDERRKRFSATKDKFSSGVQQFGTGVGQQPDSGRLARAAGKITGWGGDEDALARSKGRRIEEEKKKMREAPLNTATDVEDEAKAQVLSEKKVDLLNEEVDELIKTFDKLDTETQKAVKKKMRNSGYGHKVVEMDISREEARRQRVAAGGGSTFVPLSQNEINDMAKNVFGGMNAEVLAKQRAAAAYRDTRAAVESDEYNRQQASYVAMSSRHGQLTARGQQIFLDAQSNEQRQAFAEAEMRYTSQNPMGVAP